tara:strand:+ start:138 stop:263 length:126 start_codon:yes stop_codon:yes gene_type:complete
VVAARRGAAGAGRAQTLAIVVRYLNDHPATVDVSERVLAAV